jgi:DNA-directed RNA polymerase II subunit RPB1
MCGILAAQALGEVSTQLCLDTFHSSGISTKNVNLGIPRFTELINVSKNIKTSTMKCHQLDSVEPEDIKNKLEFKTLKDIILTSSIRHVDELVGSSFNFLNYYTKSKEESNYALILELKNDELEKLEITLFDISDKLFNYIGKLFFLKINDDNCEIPMLVVYINAFDKELSDTNKLTDNEIISRLLLLESDALNKVQLQGIEGIKKIYIEKNNNKKYIETEGTNMLESFSIKELDHTKTVSNNIIEIYNVLGIEAARKVLLDEIRTVISFDGTIINYRHIALISDIMTYKGYFMSMTRHGINRGDTSTLMRCSFEETVDVFVDAAQYAQKDYIKSISENIILGKLAPFGTGSFNVLFNNDTIHNYSARDEFDHELVENEMNEERDIVLEDVVEIEECLEEGLEEFGDELGEELGAELDEGSDDEVFVPSSP